MTEEKKPELIEDTELDDASGGLPAVQKVREAAGRTSSTAKIGQGDVILSGNTNNG